MLNNIFQRLILAICTLSLTACIEKPFVSWKEEVNLSNGKIIVVEQTKRQYRGIAVESWLTINLPEISSQPIIWHQTLDPLVVNLDGGKLYIVGKLLNGRGQEYGCLRDSYVNFVWDKGVWKRIQFDAIPKTIYVANMLIEDFPPKGTSFLSLGEKNSEKVNGDLRLPNFLKILDPDRGHFCPF